MPRPTTMLGVYAAVSVLYVGAAAASLTVVMTATKPLLMPALAAFLVSASPRPFTRMVRIVLGALAFSWLGDVLLEVSRLSDSDNLFLAGLGGFLVAQVLYVVAFAPVVRSSTPPRPPLWALAYVLYGAGLVAFLAPELGEFLLPVAVYAAAICTMGVVASGVNAWTALGAALFVASDTLLAVGRFTDLLTIGDNWERVLVIGTYLPAQGLIVVGVVIAQRGIWRTSPEPAAG